MSATGHILKRVGAAAAATVVVVGLAATCIYVASERVLKRRYDVPAARIAVPSDPLAIADGRRLAATRGCSTCHGQDLGGRLSYDEPGFARMVIPNLTHAARDYSDAELARLVRYGVRRNGQSVFEMPAVMFHGLSDDDLARIIAFIRSAPLVDGPDYVFEPHTVARLELAFGKWVPLAATLANTPPPPVATPTDPITLGLYLAETACSECHGLRLTGSESAPDLMVTAAYSNGQFVRLMKTGITARNQEVPVMSAVARNRFSHFTDREIHALYAFLKARATAPLALHAGRSRDYTSDIRPVVLP